MEHNNHAMPKSEGIMYTCPMHPEVRQEKSGLCPECGMNLIKAKGQGLTAKSVDKHKGHSTNIFKKKFWVSLALTIPVVLYADVVENIFKWSPPNFAGSEFVSLVLGSVVFFYGGWVFLAGAWREIVGRLPGMMTLIGIAIS